jgi:DNA polymerase I
MDACESVGLWCSFRDIMNGTLYIVDALNFLFRAFHALPPLTNSQGTPTGAVYGLCQMLLRIERQWRPTHLCVVYDAPGPTFRDQIFTEYKANRPPMPPDLVAQIGLSRRVVDAFGLPVLSVPGVEADDVMATLARTAVAGGLDVVLCSSDKDLMQLCGEHIHLLDTMKNKVLGPAEVVEKFGVGPEQLGDLLTLMGDSVDNVPGVAGIGPKTAADLIKQFGSLDGILAHVGEIKGKKGQSLAASLQAIEISRKLIRLREDVELGRSLEQLHRAEPNAARLRELFSELEFTRLLAQLSPADTEVTAAAETVTPDAAPQVAPAVPADAGRAEPSPASATIILDRANLERLCLALESAGSFGLAALAEGLPYPRAQLVGLAFALPDGARHYLPLGHRLLGAPTGIRAPEALQLLAPVLGSATVRKYTHDAKVIEVLLRARGVTLAGLAGDAMLAAYLLDASTTQYDLAGLAAAYGVGQVIPRSTWLGSGRGARPAGEVPMDEAAQHLGDEAWAALRLVGEQESALAKLGLTKIYREIELPLVPVLVRIECWGIRLDSDSLRQLGNEVGQSISNLEREIHQAAGGTFNIGSPKQLAEVLFGKLGLPVIRKTKTGASTDADVLEELAALHPIAAKIVEYRALTKLKGTYIDALPAQVDTRTGRLHTTFNQAVAATGRLSSSDPNLQNIPIRTELGRRIRHAFVADPGYQIVSADYSQIELRVLAHFSEDPAFLNAFASGQDIHRRTAAEIFGVALEAVSGEQRRIAKAINFGLVFGQTDFGLAQALRIPRADARTYIEGYFVRYARVRDYMEQAIAQARHTGAVSTLLGRTRPLPQINSSKVQERNYAERIARNTPIQGTAADLLKLAMIRVDREMVRFPDARLLLTVHDELVFEVRDAEVAAFSAWVKGVMESAYELRVPLVVDVHAGASWGAAH